MIGFRTTSDDINRDIELEEHRKQFTVEFNRYYFTKQYEKAFDLCINNMAEQGNRKFVYTKAMLAIEKLTNRIELSDVSRINQDWVIDTLVNNGHKNMKVNGDEIKVGITKISVTVGNKVEIKGRTVISILISIFIVLITLLVAVYITAFIDIFLEENYGLRFHEGMIIGCTVSCLTTFSSIYYFVYKLGNKYKKYIKKIALSVLYEYNNL